MIPLESRKEKMNEFEYTAKTFAEFSQKMSQAGFTDGAFRQFVNKMPCTRFGKASEGLLRKLYLAYIGLAEFSLKLNSVDMYGEELFSEKESSEFRDTNWHDFKIHPDDVRYFDRKIDLARLDIFSPLFGGEQKIKFEEGLRRISDPVNEIELASFWHGHWLIRHQEFIPEIWHQIVRKGGRIIFPKARLVSRSSGAGSSSKDVCIMYPYIEADHGGYNPQFRQSMRTCYGNSPGSTEYMRNNKDYFAFFRSPQEKSEKED